MKPIDIPIQAVQDAGEVQATQTSDCCRTTEDGSSYCAVPQDGQSASCGCNSEANKPDSINVSVSQPTLRTHIANCAAQVTGFWQKARGVVLFGVACITSPCCTPLIVPLALAFLAGTPVAAWLGSNLGWVYGGLTLVSVVSFVVALRWLNKPNPSKPKAIRLSDIPVLKSSIGEKFHVE